VNEVVTPLKSTEVVVQNPVPVRTTVVPTGPLAGEKFVTSGTFTGTKSVALSAVPIEEITLILPVVAVDGTVRTSSVVEFTVNKQNEVSINTSVTPMKLVPVTVTCVKISEHAGVKLVMEIGGMTVYVPALNVVPAVVVTVNEPLDAPIGTTALIDVDD
jgi:hypothetical protein